MRRSVVAVAWLVGTTVPALIAAVFVFGCCVLPFHHAIHELMPVCRMAAGLLHRDYDHSQEPAPAREKEQPVKRLVPATVSSFKLIVAMSGTRAAALPDATRARDLIAHGAIRCDCDVGLHLLIALLLI